MMSSMKGSMTPEQMQFMMQQNQMMMMMANMNNSMSNTPSMNNTMNPAMMNMGMNPMMGGMNQMGGMPDTLTPAPAKKLNQIGMVNNNQGLNAEATSATPLNNSNMNPL